MPLRFKRFERIRAHMAFRATRLGVAVLATLLAVAIVTTLTIDLGPGLRGIAQREGSKRIGRTLAHRQAGHPSVQWQVRPRGLRHRRPRAGRSPISQGETHRRLFDVGRPPSARGAARFDRDVGLADGDRTMARRPPQLPEVQYGRRAAPPARHHDAVREDDEMAK